MFCSQCGHSNPDGAAFCTACGSPLTRDAKAASELPSDAGIQSHTVYPQTASSLPPNQGGLTPQRGYSELPYPPKQYKKKRTGLIVGLIVGVFLLAAAAIVLFVWPGVLIQKAPGLTGYWFCEQRGDALEFKSSGSMRVFTTYNTFNGQYEYDIVQGMGVISVDDKDYDFAMTDDGLKVDGMGIYEKAGDHFDVDDFIDDMSSRIEETETPVPSEEVSAEPSAPPSETETAAQPDISGIWYETTGYGGTLEFFTDGTYNMTVADMALGGTYEYDAASSAWRLHEDLTDTTYTATLSDKGLLNLDAIQYTREFVEQIDWSSVQ